MTASRPVRFGLSFSHGGANLERGGHLFADALRAGLGFPVELEVAVDYQRLINGVLTGEIDIAWMPPMLHIRASAQGAALIAVAERRGSLFYRSALLVPVESPRTSIENLRGARAAWTDRSSASGYLFPRLHLRNRGVEPRQELESETFFGSTGAACDAVLDGRADFCACFVGDAAAGDLTIAEADIARVYGPKAKRLRVLEVTEAIPPDGIMVMGALTPSAQKHTRDVLLKIHRRAAGREALQMLMNAERLVPVSRDVELLIDRIQQSVLST
jgi:phosphate/phosphite/phosphonate ABC transporter binding protein